MNRYIMFERGICKKYQLRDEKFNLKTGIIGITVSFTAASSHVVVV